MHHPDLTYGIKRPPADSPAVKVLNEALAPELRNPIGFTPSNAQRAKNAHSTKRQKAAHIRSFNDDTYAKLATTYIRETGFKGAPYYTDNENFKKIVEHGSEALPYLVTDILEEEGVARLQVAAVFLIAQELHSPVTCIEGGNLGTEGRKEMAIHWAVTRMLEA